MESLDKPRRFSGRVPVRPDDELWTALLATILRGEDDPLSDWVAEPDRVVKTADRVARMFHSEDLNARTLIANAVLEQGRPVRLARLGMARLLRHRTATGRSAAARAIWIALGNAVPVGEDHAAALCKLSSSDPSSRVRIHATSALVYLADAEHFPRAIPTLVGRINEDPCSEVRDCATGALYAMYRRMLPEEAPSIGLRALLAACGDHSRRVQRHARSAVRELIKNSAGTIIAAAESDPERRDEVIRRLCLAASLPVGSLD
jgi:hypothetical protein